MPALDVLRVLADETAEACAPLGEAIAQLRTAGDDAARAEAAERYLERVRRLAAAAHALALPGLQQVCTHIETNLALIEPGTLTEDQETAFRDWIALLPAYLSAPKDVRARDKLVEYLSHGAWPRPLSGEEAQALVAALATIEEESPEDRDVPRRPAEASPEDIVLDIPADVNRLLVESFLTEGPLQAAVYTATIQAVIRGETGAEGVNECRRVVHAIKGAANTVGVRGVATLTHHLEDILEYLAEHGERPRGGLAKLLMDAADCLEMMFETLMRGEAPPAQAQSTLQRILDAANRVDRGEPVMDEPAVAPAPAAEIENAAAAVAAPVEPTPAFAAAPAAASSPATPVSPKVAPKLHIAATTIDEMLRLSGEMVISRAHIQERLHQTHKLLADLAERHGLLWRLAEELETVATVRGIAAGQKGGNGSTGAGGLFDALELDQYSELHGGVHAIVETTSDLQAFGNRIGDLVATLDAAVNQEDILNRELHEVISRSRMTPISTLEPRLQRAVRQACEATGKSARFAFRSGDVVLDDQVITALLDPLLHMVRNAVDHGLEDPAARLVLGKPETGAVTLEFLREGGNVVIHCHDDGAGLDLRAIRAAAVSRGLIDENAAMTDEEIARLVLLPGFSTKGNVSTVSGRGVGMDIVANRLRALNGTIQIHTESGKGCRFTLRLPLSVGTAHCLLVKAAGAMFAVPTDHLERVIYAGAKNVEHAGSGWIYRDKIDTCEVHDLCGLLEYPAPRPFGQDDDLRPVIVANTENGHTAVVIDGIQSGRDLVLKNLGKYLNGLRGVVGASLLGDGRIVPILDLVTLLRLQRGESRGESAPLAHAAAQTAAGAAHLPQVLVVDDSLSVRTALTELLTSEGFEVRQARDGVEALEEIEKARPDAVLLDLEMPRMNGLELASRLRARREYRDLPIIMVTSRSSDKHRNQARVSGVSEYLTKPFRESELLSHLRLSLHKAA